LIAARGWHNLPFFVEASVTTRNVVLTPQQSALVDGLVASGRFQNASEVLRAGLRLLEGTGEEAVRRAFARARP
jgi:putative addiction module CopG family antidote